MFVVAAVSAKMDLYQDPFGLLTVASPWAAGVLTVIIIFAAACALYGFYHLLFKAYRYMKALEAADHAEVQEISQKMKKHTRRSALAFFGEGLAFAAGLGVWLKYRPGENKNLETAPQPQQKPTPVSAPARPMPPANNPWLSPYGPNVKVHLEFPEDKIPNYVPDERKKYVHNHEGDYDAWRLHNAIVNDLLAGVNPWFGLAHFLQEGRAELGMNFDDTGALIHYPNDGAVGGIIDQDFWNRVVVPNYKRVYGKEPSFDFTQWEQLMNDPNVLPFVYREALTLQLIKEPYRLNKAHSDQALRVAFTEPAGPYTLSRTLQLWQGAGNLRGKKARIYGQTLLAFFEMIQKGENKLILEDIIKEAFLRTQELIRKYGVQTYSDLQERIIASSDVYEYLEYKQVYKMTITAEKASKKQAPAPKKPQVNQSRRHAQVDSTITGGSLALASTSPPAGAPNRFGAVVINRSESRRPYLLSVAGWITAFVVIVGAAAILHGLTPAVAYVTTDKVIAAVTAAPVLLGTVGMNRRKFLGVTAIATLAAELGLITLPAKAQSSPDARLLWLKGNVFPDGMPRSFGVSSSWSGISWRDIGAPNTPDGVIERITVNNGLVIYDGGIWQMAMAIDGNFAAADKFTSTLSAGRWQNLATIRGYTAPFLYQGKSLPEGNAYFFRILSPDWQQPDPLTDKTHFPGFPGPGYDPSLIVWSDWRPVTGENAWVILSALNTAFKKYNGNIPTNAPELLLARSLIPAMQALLNIDLGAILAAPAGTYGIDPRDVYTENNLSAYAALRKLYQLTGDRNALDLLVNIERYLKEHAFDRTNEVFFQGGLVSGKSLVPNPIFGVDCQTWAISVLGPQKIDAWFGPGTAYRMWQNTKSKAGYYVNGVLRGVGFSEDTDPRYHHKVNSVEWTAGAILACRELSAYYKGAYSDLREDESTMLEGQKSFRVDLPGGKTAYLAANMRYPVPFGWYVNPIPATAATAWMYFVDIGFNPLADHSPITLSIENAAQANTVNLVIKRNDPMLNNVTIEISSKAEDWSNARQLPLTFTSGQIIVPISITEPRQFFRFRTDYSQFVLPLDLAKPAAIGAHSLKLQNEGLSYDKMRKPMQKRAVFDAEGKFDRYYEPNAELSTGGKKMSAAIAAASLVGADAEATAKTALKVLVAHKDEGVRGMLQAVLEGVRLRDSSVSLTFSQSIDGQEAVREKFDIVVLGDTSNIIPKELAAKIRQQEAQSVSLTYIMGILQPHNSDTELLALLDDWLVLPSTNIMGKTTIALERAVITATGRFYWMQRLIDARLERLYGYIEGKGLSVPVCCNRAGHFGAKALLGRIEDTGINSETGEPNPG
ncbi:MAG: hypothetical protein NT033_07295, partial [Candidatus Omnitrophica bacterium]|nr:hypothetical protein [Candidatus Omnitrophota bacterium]